MNAGWATLLILLLPVAALSGWWAAKRNSARAGNDDQRRAGSEYFKGLNYILNEQQDKAIEIFVKMLEVDSETIETHLALGNLFRRRGEVDRAIRIHQNLIARPALNKEYKAQALLELGIDYMRLGILDRAEGLFTELVSSDMFTGQALEHLLEIYQQEQEWDKAITVAERLQVITGERIEPVIAQFYCELAILDMGNDNEKGVKDKLRRALNLDPQCVRASLIEARFAQKDHKPRAAIKAYRRVEKQDPSYLSEVIAPMKICYHELGKPDRYFDYLHEVYNTYGGITALSALTDVIAQDRGEDEAIHFLSNELEKRPTVRGVSHLITYAISKTDGELHKNLATIRQLTERLLQEGPVYRCHNCGFNARHLHWHCPGCRNWNTVKPVYGVQGE